MRKSAPPTTNSATRASTHRRASPERVDLVVAPKALAASPPRFAVSSGKFFARTAGCAGARGFGGGREGLGGFADAFGDIFGEIFGAQRGGRGNGVFRGADLRYNLELSLEDAARGTEAKIRVPALDECA